MSAIADAQFQREAYLSLADEMDPTGGPVAWDEEDWDPTFVDAARRFAAARGLPFPMMDGIDAALVLVGTETDEDDDEPGWAPPPIGPRGVRVMAEKCSTCIFRPGNLMMLKDGRVKQMLDDVRRDDSHIPCHQTLGLGQPTAICRGQADAYQGWLLRNFPVESVEPIKEEAK